MTVEFAISVAFASTTSSFEAPFGSGDALLPFEQTEL